VSVGLRSSGKKKKRVTFTATPTSSVGASFTKFRWDFGDGSAILTTTGPTVEHRFRRGGRHEVRVEATDSLGHSAIGERTIRPGRGDDDDRDHDDDDD
jgi:hypothetical protein